MIKDKNKTKGKLINELVEMRQRITQLRALETKHKRDEKTLRRAGQEKVAFLDSISELALYQDTKMRILWANRAVGELVGLAPEQLVGRHCYEIWHQRSKPCAGCPIQKVRETGQSQQAEMATPDGRVWFIQGYPVRDANGDIVGAVEITQEITERNRAQMTLESEKKHLEALFKSVPQGIATENLEHKIIEVNPAFTEMFGYTLEEIRGKDIDEIIVPREKLSEARKITRQYSEGKISTVETVRKRKDGSLIPVQITGAQIIVDNKQVGVYGIYKDVTGRKLAEEALQGSEARYRSFVEKSLQGIWEIDATSKTTFCNRAMAEMLDLSPEELIGRNFMEFMDEEWRKKAEVLFSCRKQGISEFHDFTFQRKSGKPLHAILSTFPLIDDEGKLYGAVVFVLDLTERRRAEKKLQGTLEKLRRALGATIQALALTVEMRDAYTAGHQRRVTNLARNIATEMQLSERHIDGIRMAGAIHDIGKIGVPAEILNKPVRLMDIEFALVKIHPVVGYNILKQMEFPWPVAKIVLQHHERMNGSGYPHGVSGEDILLEARILGVADVVEAMSSHRPYRPALGIDKALEEISKNKGILYDSQVVDACLKLLTEKRFRFK